MPIKSTLPVFYFLLVVFAMYGIAQLYVQNASHQSLFIDDEHGRDVFESLIIINGFVLCAMNVIIYSYIEYYEHHTTSPARSNLPVCRYPVLDWSLRLLLVAILSQKIILPSSVIDATLIFTWISGVFFLWVLLPKNTKNIDVWLKRLSGATFLFLLASAIPATAGDHWLWFPVILVSSLFALLTILYMMYLNGRSFVRAIKSFLIEWR